MKDFHFDITPHIVKQLGEQLVSDEITALLELIKNSYDADASYVSIDINTSGQYLEKDLFFKNHKGFIIIQDDGFGMSEDTILRSWLVISYSQKRAQKDSKILTPKGRTPLGDKGLGRLSTQRLADTCEIFTNEEGKEGSHVAFNWKDFETEITLGSVKVLSTTFKSNPHSGTTLFLGNINHAEVWEGSNLEKFKGQVSQIISPYKENRPFDVYLSINGISIDLDKSNENLRDLAISRFGFTFDGKALIISGKTKLAKFIGKNPDDFRSFIEPDSGKKFHEYLKIKQSDLIFHPLEHFYLGFEKTFSLDEIGGLEILDGEWANPGSFFGKIDEFNLNKWAETITEVFGKLANYREFAKSQAGIKIYRDGFAVIPYGMNGVDWLNLGGEQTGGSSYYGIRPSNVIGYFSIDEGNNSNLKDKTDRQGFISNSYSRNFFTISSFVVDEINRYQEKIRRAYNDFLKEYKQEKSSIKTVTQAFNQLKETRERTNEVKKEFENSIITVAKTIDDADKIVRKSKGNQLFASEEEKETGKRVESILLELRQIQSTLDKLSKVVEKAEKLNDVIDILEPKIQILEEQLGNFSELASLGLISESISHEFNSIADRLSEKSGFYSNKLKSKALTDSDIFVLMEYINSTVNGLKTQLKHLDPALKYNREKKWVFSISDFFSDEKEYYKNRFEYSNIDFDINVIQDFSISVNRGKLTQVIDNLLNNSEYWLKQKRKIEPSFKPGILIAIDSPWIYVQDNGYGIPKAIENQLFEPFVTTKPRGEGRGLGLFIVQQLLDSFECSIILEQTRNKDDRKYIFALNLSNIIENND